MLGNTCAIEKRFFTFCQDQQNLNHLPLRHAFIIPFPYRSRSATFQCVVIKETILVATHEKLLGVLSKSFKLLPISKGSSLSFLSKQAKLFDNLTVSSLRITIFQPTNVFCRLSCSVSFKIISHPPGFRHCRHNQKLP